MATGPLRFKVCEGSARMLRDRDSSDGGARGVRPCINDRADGADCVATNARIYCSPGVLMVLINAYCTHRSPPELDFTHELNNRRDHGDPELAPHLDGFAGFVMQGGKRAMTASLFHVLGHIQRVQHQLSFEVDDDSMDDLAGWAHDANAILFLPDATVRDPNGLVLVDPASGEPESGAEIPYPADARKRKKATERQLKSLGVSVPESLPPVVGEVEVLLREPGEVATRAQALMAIAVLGESHGAGDPIPVKDLEAKIPAGVAALTRKERRFFTAKRPTKQDILDATWRYEALQVLAWTLGLVDELAFPSKICDVPALAKAMLKSKDDLIPRARLVKPAKVLDALDLHYRLHWAVRQAELDKKKTPADLEQGVVAERHHALNWLVRFQDADWDDVDTPT